tara:strand:- start:11849 stop:12445 length:597 start_codon:yes stop_codon:yes gene_type:complete
MSKSLSEILVGDTELSTDRKRLISMALITLATVVAWLPHERTVNFLFWQRTLSSDGFLPDFLTAIFGLMIVLPLYFRNILHWRTTSVYSILSFAVNLTLVSTFCRIIVGDGFEMTSTTMGMIVALTLTWLGMRAVASLAWLAVIALGIFSLMHRNYIMGIEGFFFILFGSIGILLQAETTPAKFYGDLKSEFFGPSAD